MFHKLLKKLLQSKAKETKKKITYHNLVDLGNQYKYHSLNGRMVDCNSCGRLQFFFLHFPSNVVNVSMIYSSF